MLECPSCKSTESEVNRTDGRKPARIERTRTCKSCGRTFGTRETVVGANSATGSTDLRTYLSDLANFAESHGFRPPPSVKVQQGDSHG